MNTKTRWQDWVALVFGIWLLVSPLVLGYSTEGGPAAWNGYVLGVAVIVFAVAALSRPQMWEEWVNLVLGIWLIISPFVLGFADQTAALWNNLLLGVLVGADAIWAMIQAPERRTA